MQRHPPHATIPESARGAAIALGNFDGVHLGHRAVIASARAVANARRAPLAAAAFAPHPRTLLQPGAPPFRLQSESQRARALAAEGVEHFFEITFDGDTMAMTDRGFAAEILAGRYRAAHVSVGENFRFGRGRMGGVQELTAFGAELGFSVDVVSPVTHGDGARVSSTAIREAVARGDVALARTLLGRPWAVEGEVVRGFARGRELGFPTANVALGDYVRPRLGVYAARVNLAAAVALPAVASIGVNPTVGALPAPLLEVYILDFSADIYGAVVEVELIGFLREEAKFESLDALKAQMGVDVARAREVLNC